MSCEDQAFSDFPDKCMQWKCTISGKDHKLKKNEYGFMVCPVCQGSYGKRTRKTAPKDSYQQPRYDDIYYQGVDWLDKNG